MLVDSFPFIPVFLPVTLAGFFMLGDSPTRPPKRSLTRPMRSRRIGAMALPSFAPWESRPMAENGLYGPDTLR